MAIKKSDLYSSLWASCDELRGGMDASQYKDYVLFMLFIKYISDKYADSNDFAPPVVIPHGASFKDMIALKGKPDIGDRINTEIIQPLIDANSRLARSDFPNFNDPEKLGTGAEMVERLSNLVSIFQKPELDFSQILDTFRNWDTERCEIVATLYAAWNDLLREKGSVSDDMIVNEVLNNWHESKQRIPEERWLKALSWMREKGYVPGPIAAEPDAR